MDYHLHLPNETQADQYNGKKYPLFVPALSRDLKQRPRFRGRGGAAYVGLQVSSNEDNYRGGLVKPETASGLSSIA